MESNNDSDAGAESHTIAGNFGFPECGVLGSKRFFLIFDRTGDSQLNFDGLMVPGSKPEGPPAQGRPADCAADLSILFTGADQARHAVGQRLAPSDVGPERCGP